MSRAVSPLLHTMFLLAMTLIIYFCRRFFAANELKAMLAHVVLNYDVRLAGDLPGNRWFGSSAVLNKDAQVMFRKRQV